MLHLVRERLVGGIHAGPHRIAAVRGRRNASQDRTEGRAVQERDIAMPCLGDIRMLLVAAQDYELGMSLVLQRLQKRMYLQRAKAAAEMLVLLARYLLIA